MLVRADPRLLDLPFAGKPAPGDWPARERPLRDHRPLPLRVGPGAVDQDRAAVLRWIGGKRSSSLFEVVDPVMLRDLAARPLEARGWAALMGLVSARLALDGPDWAHCGEEAAGHDDLAASLGLPHRRRGETVTVTAAEYDDLVGRSQLATTYTNAIVNMFKGATSAN
jgi:hypothetical protein